MSVAKTPDVRRPLAGLTVHHITSEHAADDVRVYGYQAKTLADAGAHVHIFARPPASRLRDDIQWTEIPAYSRVTRPRPTWDAIHDVIANRGPAPDVVHVHEPLTAIAARLMDWCARDALIYDAHEWYAAMVTARTGGVKRMLLSRIADRQDRTAARRSAAVITVNESLAARYKRFNRNVHVVTNAPRFRPPIGVETSATLVNPNRVIYAGAMSRERGLDTMLMAMRRLESEAPDAVLELVGRPADQFATDSVAAIQRGEHPNVRYLGTMPHDSVLRRLDTAAIGLVPFRKHKHANARPIKLLEYAMSTCAIVTTNGGPSADFVQKHDAGAVCDEIDDVAMADAIARRCRDHTHSHAEALNAYNAAAPLSWEQNDALTLIAAYQSVRNLSAPPPSAHSSV